MFWRFLSLNKQDKNYKAVFDNFAIVESYSHNFETIDKTTDLKIIRITNEEAGVYYPSNNIRFIS